MSTPIALGGDDWPEIAAHRAIPRAPELVRRAVPAAAGLAWEWVATHELRSAARDRERFAAVGLVPASPYSSAHAT